MHKVGDRFQALVDFRGFKEGDVATITRIAANSPYLYIIEVNGKSVDGVWAMNSDTGYWGKLPPPSKTQWLLFDNFYRYKGVFSSMTKLQQFIEEHGKEEITYHIYKSEETHHAIISKKLEIKPLE